MSTNTTYSFIPMDLMRDSRLRGAGVGATAKLSWAVIESYRDEAGDGESVVLYDASLIVSVGKSWSTIKRARDLLVETGWLKYESLGDDRACYWPQGTMAQHLLNDLGVNP